MEIISIERKLEINFENMIDATAKVQKVNI